MTLYLTLWTETGTVAQNWKTKNENLLGKLIIKNTQNIDKGPFKYYVIMFLTFLDRTFHLFDDVQ